MEVVRSHHPLGFGDMFLLPNYLFLFTFSLPNYYMYMLLQAANGSIILQAKHDLDI
jgi:hypothetical protein